MQKYEEREFCKNCNRVTPCRKEHEDITVPGAFAVLRSYCKECGQLIRETTFK